jgi:natural product precursor
MKKNVKKLVLSRETVAYLSERKLGNAVGGGTAPYASCGCDGETSNGPYNCFTCGLSCQC